MTCEFYTKAEIAKHNLSIPTDDEVDELLATIDNVTPSCGSLSGSTVVPNEFCVCSRTATGSNSVEVCDICDLEE